MHDAAAIAALAARKEGGFLVLPDFFTMVDTLLSGPRMLVLFRFLRRDAPSEGPIRSFICDFGAAWAGSGRVCFKTGAAQLSESD